MASYRVEAEVLLKIATTLELAEGEAPCAEDVEFCLLEDLQDTQVWEVDEVKALRYKHEEIPDD